MYTYNPENGRVASVSNTVSGITTSYAYDIMDRATNITYRTSSGSLIRSLEYAYDAGTSMITNKAIVGVGGTTSVSSYTYDSIDRLIHESASANSAPLRDIQYNYDLAGNRSSVVAVDGIGDPVTNSYTLGVGNRLASWGINGTALYDTAGNTTNLNGMALNWDERYRLERVSRAEAQGTQSIDYGYDVQNRKISRTKGGTTEYYIYDGNHIVADTDSSGNILRSYTYGPGTDPKRSADNFRMEIGQSPVHILFMTVHVGGGSQASATHYQLKDCQNEVIILVDSGGSVEESFGVVSVYTIEFPVESGFTPENRGFE